MNSIDLLNHLLNFVAPALWVAVLVPLLARFFTPKKKFVTPSLPLQIGVNFVVNLTLLGIGLWFYGRDGKMGTYGGMTMACATSQWLMTKAWKY
jgi:hypothetical protein